MRRVVFLGIGMCTILMCGIGRDRWRHTGAQMSIPQCPHSGLKGSEAGTAGDKTHERRRNRLERWWRGRKLLAVLRSCFGCAGACLAQVSDGHSVHAFVAHMPVQHLWEGVTKQDTVLRQDRGCISLTRYDMPAIIMLDEAGAYILARKAAARWRAKAQKQHIEVRDAGKIRAVRFKKRRMCAGGGHEQASSRQQNAVLQAQIAGHQSTHRWRGPSHKRDAETDAECRRLVLGVCAGDGRADMRPEVGKCRYS